MYDFDRFGEVTPSTQRSGNCSRRGGYLWQHCHDGELAARLLLACTRVYCGEPL